MNRFQKKILIIAAGIANVSLTLSAAAVATYAWFSVNATADILVNNVSGTISTISSDSQLQYEILKYDDNVKAGVSSTNPNDFYLPDYDSYITERNVYANAIIRAEIFTPVSTSTDEFIIDVSRLASAFKQNGAVQSYTSNVIQFKATVFSYKLSGSQSYTHNTASSDSIDETSAATKYATASAYFASRETPTTFVQIRDNSDGSSVITRKAEADTITLVPSLPDGLSIDSCIIYIECSYHQKLVEEYIITNEAAELSHHSLSGDISSILFGHRTKTANASNATGRYVKVQSSTLAATGTYLPTYEYSALQGKILDGQLATTNTAPSSSTYINTKPNYKTTAINSASGNIPQSIDSTDDIDASAFAYSRVAGTLKSSSGQYIGRDNSNTSSNGIQSNSISTGLENDITFSGGQAHIVSRTQNDRELQFNSNANGDVFGYYKGTMQNIDVYRYSENVSEIPTVTSINVDHSDAIKTFYTNHTFEITGLVVTAYYSDGSTADVTGACTFTSPTGVTSLVPTVTTFNSAESNKEVYINYTEGGFSSNTNHYTIQVIAEAVTSLYTVGSISKTNYYVGDTFSYSNLQIWARYNSGIADANVTSSTTFGGYNMSTAGSYTVTASYGGITLNNVGTISVKAKTLSLDNTELTVYIGDTETITVTHNAAVTVSMTTGTTSIATFTPSSLSYTDSTYTNKTSTVSVTGVSAGTIVLTFSSSVSGFTSKTCTITVKKAPIDDLVITGASSGNNAPWDSSGYTSGSGISLTNGGESIGISYTNVYRNAGIQLKAGTNNEFHSTSTTGKYIKSVTITAKTNSYVLYMSTNGSSWTTIGTYNTTQTLNFTSSNGYKYFKVSATSSYCQISDISVSYYKVSVTSVDSVATHPTAYHRYETPDASAVTLNVTYDDGTNGTEIATSVTCDTSTSGSKTATATFAEATGTNSATFTVTVGTISSISIDTAPTKTSYASGQKFDPAGLKIKVNYSGNIVSQETITYSDDTASRFSFTPSLNTSLTTSNTSVTISYGGKSTTQAITVTSGSSTANFTLSSANSVTVDGVTITFAKGSGSTAPTWYAAGLRLYAKNTITITCSSNITQIVFNWEKQGNKAFANCTASTGSYTHPSNTGTGTWTGSAKTITFTLGSSGQLQINTLSVTHL